MTPCPHCQRCTQTRASRWQFLAKLLTLTRGGVDFNGRRGLSSGLGFKEDSSLLSLLLSLLLLLLLALTSKRPSSRLLSSSPLRVDALLLFFPQPRSTMSMDRDGARRWQVGRAVRPRIVSSLEVMGRGEGDNQRAIGGKIPLLDNILCRLFSSSDVSPPRWCMCPDVDAPPDPPSLTSLFPPLAAKIAKLTKPIGTRVRDFDPSMPLPPSLTTLTRTCDGASEQHCLIAAAFTPG